MLPPFIRDKIIPKLDHYRRVVKDKSATVSERDVATRRYEQLMTKHKITEDMLDFEDVVEESFIFENPYQYILLMTIAESYTLSLRADANFIGGRVRGPRAVMEALKETYEITSEKIDSYMVGMLVYYAHKGLQSDLRPIRQVKEWDPYRGDEPIEGQKLLDEPNPFTQYQEEELPESLDLEDFEEIEEEEETLDDVFEQFAEEHEQPAHNPAMDHKTLRKLFEKDEYVQEMVQKMKKADKEGHSYSFEGMFR